MSDRRIHAVRDSAGPAQADVLETAAIWSRVLVGAVVLVAGAHLTGLLPLSPSVILVLAALGFLAGVPHGGVDHLMAVKLSGGKPAAVVVAAYAGLAVAVWAVLRWGGPVALTVVVALSAVHFGLGELMLTRELTGWRPSWPVSAALITAGSGALLLPIARSGEEFNRVAAAVSPGLAQLIGAAPVRIAVSVLWVAAATMAITAALAAGHRATALDITLIGALGMLAPPLVAFAAWFGGWHALRHCARMLHHDPDCAALLAAHQPRAAWLRLARLAAPMSAAALTVIVALAWFTVTAADQPAALAEVLRLLLALTVPHMVVVWWLDRRATG